MRGTDTKVVTLLSRSVYDLIPARLMTFPIGLSFNYQMLDKSVNIHTTVMRQMLDVEENQYNCET